MRNFRPYFRFTLVLFLAILSLGACEGIDMEEESETFEPVTFRITGYMQNDEEVRFSYENCSGISASYDLDAFYDVHIIYDNTDNLTESLTSIQFSVKKKGIAYIYIHRNLETEPHHFEDEITGTIIIGCKKRNDSITCDASFNNLKCIMARQG